MVPSLWCQGSEASSSVEASGDLWSCKENNHAGQEQSAAFSAGTFHVGAIAGRLQFLSSCLRDGEIMTVTLGS